MRFYRCFRIALLACATAAFPLALGAQPVEVAFPWTPCQTLELIRELKAKGTLASPLGDKGQCLTVDNADGGTEREEDPPAITTRFVGGAGPGANGATVLAVRWDGAPLVPPAALAPGWSYRLDADPAVAQPEAALLLIPDTSGTAGAAGAIAGRVELAARLVVTGPTGSETELPLPLALKVDGRYAWQTVGANPNLSPPPPGNATILIVDPAGCDLPPGSDCLWRVRRERPPAPPATTYCYCDNCSFAGGCTLCEHPWCGD